MMPEPEVKSNFEGELLHGSAKARRLLRMRTSFQVRGSVSNIMAHRSTEGGERGGHGTGRARRAGSQEHLQETPRRKSSKPGNDVTNVCFAKLILAAGVRERPRSPIVIGL